MNVLITDLGMDGRICIHSPLILLHIAKCRLSFEISAGFFVCVFVCCCCRVVVVAICVCPGLNQLKRDSVVDPAKKKLLKF